MKNITVEGWNEIHVDKNQEFFPMGTKIKEGGTMCVSISDIQSSCDISLLNSEYLHNTLQSVYGEASSAIDRGLELAFSVMNEDEVANITLSIEGKFINENLMGNVKICCTAKYRIIQNGKEVYDYDTAEKVLISHRYKEIGIRKLKQHQVDSSVKSNYPLQISVFLLIARAIKWLSIINPDNLTKEDEENIKLLKIQCYNNLGHFHLAFGNYELAALATTNVLNEDKNNIKALYRRAVANTNLQNYEIALEDLSKILSVEPSNSSAKKQVNLILHKQKSHDMKLAQAMKKYLGM